MKKASKKPNPRETIYVVSPSNEALVAFANKNRIPETCIKRVQKKTDFRGFKDKMTLNGGGEVRKLLLLPNWEWGIRPLAVEEWELRVGIAVSPNELPSHGYVVDGD